MKTAQPKADASGSEAIVGKWFVGRTGPLEQATGTINAYLVNGYYLITVLKRTGVTLFQNVASLEELSWCELFDHFDDLALRTRILREKGELEFELAPSIPPSAPGDT